MPTAVDSSVLSAAGAEQLHADTPASRDVTHSRMRRVASAPAFKHASCYQEVSPTAAVAAAAATAAATATAEGAARARQPAAQQRLRAPQPCSSCSGGRCNCLEVYVVSRSFSEFAGPVMKRLHPEARDGLVDIGICHYMTVFKTPDGQMVQFDFGPLGGDVQKAHGPLAAFLRRARAAAQKQQTADAAGAAAAAAAAAAASAPAAAGSSSAAVEQPTGGSGRGMVHSPSAPSLPMASLDLAAYGGGGEAAMSFVDTSSNSDRPKRGVAGEIRERQLQQLPPACMYMGRTSLTLDDIRRYNAVQGRQTYTLHENDCRHYVNSLVQYTTGVERSTQHLKRHYFHTRHADRWLWYGWVVSAAQLVTDVGNWSHIQAGAAVTLLAVTGRSTLASLKTLATPVLPALKGLPALLPSAGLAAAGAGAAAAAPGPAAAAATAGTGGTVMGAFATTLKLPAALLLKRPLAAGAAAGGAGAAAAVVRDAAGTTGGPGSGSSSTNGTAGRTWGAVGRPLQAVGDGMAHGVRSAVLGLRRLAVGNTRALQQLRQEPLVLPEQELVGTGHRGSAWGRRSSSGAAIGDQPARRWFGYKRPSNGQVAVPAAMAAAAVGGDGQQSAAQEQEQQQQPAQRRPLAQFGRHVVWLGSAAARASGQLAMLAFGGSRIGQYAAPAPTAAAGAVAVGEGSSRGVLMHSASSQQLQLTQQQQPARALSIGDRSLSMPSLLAAPPAGGSGAEAVGAAGAAPAAAAGQVSFSVSSSGGSRDGGSCGGTPLSPLGGADLTFMWDSGSSSITSSSFGSKSTGVGRQTLNLPAPRISWGKRATQAMIVRQ